MGLLQRLRRAKVAFVLSGGGNLGAIQVGMLRALVERDIRPDLVLGCSVGALNGAAYAADPTPAGVRRLEELWLAIDDDEVMPSGWLPPTVMLARKRPSVHGNDGLRALVAESLGVERFEDLKVPFQCVATAVEPAQEAWFEHGPLVDPILASAALPGIFPLVSIGDLRYMDGAVVNDVPVTRAHALGARTIYVLHVGTLDRPWLDPKRPLDVIVQAYWIARRHRYREDLAALPARVRVEVLPVGSPPRLKYNDFSHSRELMTQAYAATAAHLDARRARGRGSPEALPDPLPVGTAEPPVTG
ncbi:MAG: patatin-like phospholipase family protein [Acidimicrobiales bacterium]|nr:patatin-like phospholipase family protein [Acidimicrobiales bacterium]MCB1016679.1 patatin-like phospholipase family protein [Acidimicrobiales bacterium]MCB9373698.1 patatin-like phospholipase family protein [Microthrixaceae bacterium]